MDSGYSSGYSSGKESQGDSDREEGGGTMGTELVSGKVFSASDESETPDATIICRLNSDEVGPLPITILEVDR